MMRRRGTRREAVMRLAGVGIIAVAAGLLALPSAAAARSAAVARHFQRLHPCPATGLASGRCPGWVRDHKRPLCAGGADAVGNMQWQRRAESLAKDRQERALCRGQRRPPGG
jgi:hypothetical protein